MGLLLVMAAGALLGSALLIVSAVRQGAAQERMRERQLRIVSRNAWKKAWR